MGIVFTNCPDCAGPIQSRDGAGIAPSLCRCVVCKTVWVKGDTKRFKLDMEDLAGLLKKRHDDVAQNSEEARTRQLIESDASDPRWQ